MEKRKFVTVSFDSTENAEAAFHSFKWLYPRRNALPGSQDFSRCKANKVVVCFDDFGLGEKFVRDFFLDQEGALPDGCHIPV